MVIAALLQDPMGNFVYISISDIVKLCLKYMYKYKLEQITGGAYNCI